MLKLEPNHKIKIDTGEISEIFSSIQGEGLSIGEKHLFVRFRSCNIACDYCDEHDKLNFKDMAVAEVIDSLKILERDSGPHEYVSLTGGEPLVYSGFLKNLMPELKRSGFRIFLETNGTLSNALRQVLPFCDMIAMDIKLPSVTKERSFFGEHEEFLKVAILKPAFVKMIISKDVLIPEFLTAVKLIARVSPDIPLVLQPKTDLKDNSLESGIGEVLSSLVSLARRELKQVRLIPQTHKWLNIQ
ncbi:MAG: 7-carboxy-7-deazaguanine synthase QueE [Candidatus Omnitrophica bacterium]|nr:7-carboxy-7-deazaguanine synthase QueE [Candidatus Omnitrophota bacterium]